MVLEALNQALFLKINAGTGTAGWLIGAARFIADDLIYLIPVLLAGMWLWGNRDNRSVAVRAFLTAMLGLGLNQIVGALWPHPRPFAIGLGQAWATHVADSSFPSDHMTLFTAIGLSLVLGRVHLLGWLTLAVGAGVGWARVFLGLHFPFDMLGAVAVAVACLSYAFLSPPWRVAGERLTQMTEESYRKAMAWPICQGWVRR